MTTTSDAVDEEYQKLSAMEVQSLRALIEKNKRELPATFQVPDLPISESDKDRFADCLCEGVPFSEELERYKGKLKVTLRSKLKWEEDMITEQVRKDFEDEYTKADGHYRSRLLVYNLCFELTHLDNVRQQSISKNTDLRKFVQDSIFEQMPQPKLLILLTLMAQFDDKVSRLCRIALPDFSNPGADS